MKAFTCPICGQELIEKTGTYTCSFCGAIEQGEWICPNGHYQCEECRLATQDEIIERVCLNTDCTDPVEMANLIMKHPSFNDFGVEHHFLVTPVILTAVFNLKHRKIESKDIRRCFKRAENIPYGTCGSRGDCGACVGSGTAVSILLKTNYMSDRERSLVMLTTAKALLKISEMGGARCCKQSVYAAIETFWQELKDILELPTLKSVPIKCEFSGMVEECKKERCSYFIKK